MDYKNIENLIKVLSESNLTYLELTEGDTKILMKKESFKEYIVKSDEGNSQAAINIEQQAVENEYSKELPKSEGNVVKAPIVGTVYLSPSPDSEPFVNVGDKVVKGQTICIIEAMKLMNEIQSDFDGTVEEILVDNMAMVEYGEPLIRVKE